MVSSTAAGRLQEENDNDKFDEDEDDFAFNQDLMNVYLLLLYNLIRVMSFLLIKCVQDQ